MNAVAILVGSMLGALGAMSHLAVTYWRARLVCAGRPGTALWLLPLAFAGPALALLAAVAVDRQAAWAAVPGLAVVRVGLLNKLRAPHDA